MKHIPVRLLSLAACAALIGSVTYLRAGDLVAQDFAGPENQNDLRPPTKDIAVEMHEGTNMAAVPSPDGTKMVLSLQGGLWIIPASGGTATKITSWDVEATQPVWSPDGRWIAFQNYSTDANYAIWVVKSDGSQLHPLTSGPFDDREPSWYPDSNKVIFSSDRSNDKQYKIWSVTFDGVLQQLTTRTGAESNPVVSPDGTKIAFVDNGNTIYTMPANQSAAPTQFGTGNYPQWTPNSASLVYQNTAGNLVLNGNAVTNGEDLFPFPVQFMGQNKFVYTASGKIRTRDATGGNLQDIAFSATQLLRRPKFTPAASRPSLGNTGTQRVKGINGPVISPDGTKVMFVDNDRVNPRFREGYNKLRVADIATKTATWYAVGPAPAVVSDRTEGAAVWSPDGKKVAFISDSVLKVMPTNADGSPAGPAVQLTAEASDMPSWQADSQTILYMASGKLKKIKVDGTAQQDIALDLTYKPASPQGRTIVHAGALWTGLEPTLQHDVDIVINGNRITSIEPHKDRPQTPHTTFVDAS